VLLSLISDGHNIISILIVLVSSISVFYYIRVVKVVFFEPGNSQINNSQFQNVFKNDFFDIDCVVMSLCLFLLVFFFFFPSLLFLFSQNIVLGLFSV